ncbi:MAG: DUF262 domain-containing protein [Proteobacteria bacterium]|nr:DUF262 domain-containing protein [Pseudomonadota bacterium]
MARLEHGALVPENFQRPGGQWAADDRGRLIESIVAGYPIGVITVWHDEPNDRELIVDGQQRMTTLSDYLQGGFHCPELHKCEYDDPDLARWIAGRTFEELAPPVQKQIRNASVNFCVLPARLSVHDRLQIFAKINQVGEPLHHHDVRLAECSASSRVDFFRLAGVPDPEHPHYQVMVQSSQEQFGLTYPWRSHADWSQWWSERYRRGQAPSEMILLAWMIRHRDVVAALIERVRSSSLTIPGFLYKDTVQAALTLICMQLAREDGASENNATSHCLPPLASMQAWFRDFEMWFVAMRKKCPRTKPGSRRKIAVFLGLAPELLPETTKLTASQWERIDLLLTGRRDEIIATFGDPGHIRGKWAGQQGYTQWMHRALTTIAAA